MEPRKWVLQKGFVKTSRGNEAVIVAVGPMPKEGELIEVTETDDTLTRIPDYEQEDEE